MDRLYTLTEVVLICAASTFVILSLLVLFFLIMNRPMQKPRAKRPPVYQPPTPPKTDRDIVERVFGDPKYAFPRRDPSGKDVDDQHRERPTTDGQ